MWKLLLQIIKWSYQHSIVYTHNSFVFPLKCAQTCVGVFHRDIHEATNYNYHVKPAVCQAYNCAHQHYNTDRAYCSTILLVVSKRYIILPTDYVCHVLGHWAELIYGTS